MSKYSYQPLTSRQFRLLTLLPGAESSPIQTTLRHVNLKDKPRFDALSYEWGPESSNNSQIYVDNEPFTIRRNLWLFLTRLRASGHSAQEIYVDAICINQKDGEEKGRQVVLMSEIYMRAKKVLVWLGEHDRNSEMVFGTSLQDYVSNHFLRMMRKNKGGLDGIPRSFLLYFWKQNQKHHGVFGRGKPYFPDTDIFELAFNFQYTECQTVLDHVFGLLALEDPSKSPPIIPNYDISAQNLFIKICMLKLPTAAASVNKATDDGVFRVAMLFRGLRLTFDDAEEILDILFNNNQSQTQNSFVIATIAKAFDQFGLLKPERKQWILPQTKVSPTAEQIIFVMRQWQIAQKKSGNWYNINHTAQIHEPPGMTFLQLDEPLWSHYSTLRDTSTRNAANAANAQNMNNMNMNLNNMNLNTMNIMNMNNAAMMAPAGMGFAGGPMG
ncbi:hypothetical protein B7463_g7395, partial [Scytalidium lignicola]